MDDHKQLIELCAAIRDLANLNVPDLRDKLKKRADQIADRLLGPSSPNVPVPMARLAEHAYEAYCRNGSGYALWSELLPENQDGWIAIANEVVSIAAGLRPDVIPPRDIRGDADQGDIHLLQAIRISLNTLIDFDARDIEISLKAVCGARDLKLGTATALLRSVFHAYFKKPGTIYTALAQAGKDRVLQVLDTAIAKREW